MKSVVALIAVAGIAGAASAFPVVAFEDFDGGALNLNSTTNVFDYNAGGGTAGDVFGRVGPAFAGGPGGSFDIADDSVVGWSSVGGTFTADSRGLSGQNGSSFFGMVDGDGNIDGAGNGLNDATWSFNLGGQTVTSIDMRIGAIGDWEAASQDGFVVRAQVDGGGYTEIFRGVVDESANKDYRPMDSGLVPNENDPLELYTDGVATGIFLDKSDAATGLFDLYSSTALAGLTGATLDIQISWEGSPSGSEAAGFDDITINGVPAPGSLALLGLSGLAMRRRR